MYTAPILAAGADTADATSASTAATDFAAQLLPASTLDSSPLRGRKVGLLKQLTGSGVDPAIDDAFQAACRQLQSLGASVEEVRGFLSLEHPVMTLQGDDVVQQRGSNHCGFMRCISMQHVSSSVWQLSVLLLARLFRTRYSAL